MTYPYPGDTTSGLMSAVSAMSSAYGDLTLLSSDITQSQSQLSNSWTGPAADKAKADVDKLVTVLPDLAKRMNAASTAVQDLENTINGIQIQIDGLRTDHAKYVTELQGYQATIGRASRFGEANDMTPAEIETYRSSLQADAKKVQGRIDDLDADYKRLVRQANTATDLCSDKLKRSYQVSVYRNSQGENVSLASGFGLDVLQVAHFDKMVADAKAFEKDVKGINNTDVNPGDRQNRIKALMAKYGDDVTDPVFATTVATDEGPDYFRKLEATISNYFHGAPGGSAPGQMDLDKDFFKFNAQILATATNQANPEHVDTDFIKHMFGYGNAPDVPEPGSIMGGAAYLSVGVPFPKAYLDTLGQYAISYEQSHLNAAGYVQPAWQTYADSRFAWAWGQGPFTNIGNNNDPLDPIMKQYAQNPDSTSALFSDAGGPDGKGDLYYLTHRNWPEGGATDLSQAIVGETGPYAGDLAKSAAIAGSVVHDVAQDSDKVPSQLHAGVAKVIARYMNDVIDTESPTGGLPGSNSTTQTSGLDEGDLMHAHFSKEDLAGALKVAYSDTDDTDNRKILSTAWAKISTEKLSGALTETANGYHAGEPLNTALIKNTVGSDMRTLGLLTQSDTNAFGDEVARQNEEAEHRRQILESLAGLVPLPEVPELGGVLGKIAPGAYDSAVDMLKGGAIDGLNPTQGDDVVNAHTDETAWKALNTVDAYPKSIVTALSHMGLPVIDAPGGPTAVVSDPGHLFTDANGHLLTPDQILAGPDPMAATSAFNEWYARQEFTSGHNAGIELDSTFQSQYQAGTGEAKH